MNFKKAIAAFMLPLVLNFQTFAPASAAAGAEPLQVFFSDGGKEMKIFTAAQFDDAVSVLIGKDTFPAELVKSGIKVNTTFLIDNSTSMPYGLRNEIKAAVEDYVGSMPENESVKVAKFDTETTVLADEYSRDREYISYELTKVDFEGQASLVYDSLLNSANSVDTNQDIYYRTVLITDGIDSIEGTSFDYLRTELSENGRYHVDVVQVSESGDKKDVNLSAIADLGSNTFTMFGTGTRFESLKPPAVSLVKVKLNNEVTTGELKGVTVKGSSNSVSMGSILFPQVEIEPVTTTVVTTTETTTTETTTTTSKVTTTEAVTTEETTAEPETEEETTEAEEQEEDDDDDDDNMMLILMIAGGGLLLVAVTVAIFMIVRSKKKHRKHECMVSVAISKDDARDQNGVGTDVWKFRSDGEFRVGRTLEPTGADRSPLPKNHKAICENATNDDISSIGRNAFVLTYDTRVNTISITNTAQGAVFTVENVGSRITVRSGESVVIMSGSKILLGNYTTVTVTAVTVQEV